MSLIVLVSNLGGGIKRHLELAGAVMEIDVHELPGSESLLDKTRTARHKLSETGTLTVVTHGVAAAVAVRHRGRAHHGIRHIEFWHGDPFFLSTRRRLVYRALAGTGKSPDVQVFTHECLVPLYGSRSSDRQILSNTVPVPETTFGVEGDTSRRAVYLGRLSPEKGLDDLLRAWPEDSSKRGWKLDVYGAGSAGGTAPPPGVTLHGETDDPLGVLAAAALVVIPSWTETGPYTACEAMSVGRPFIGTRTGDMPEFLRSGCGWEVPIRDPIALRRALLEAQSATTEELDNRGERGRCWLREARPFEQWARDIERIYSP